MKKVSSTKGVIYSIGIAILISAPISKAAMQSWENTPQIQFESLSEPFSGTQETMSAIAEAEKMRQVQKQAQKTQELVAAEELRQERLDHQEREIAIAREVLAEHGVEVPDDVRTFCELAQEESNVCAELLEAICFRESTFRATATNGDCCGLMQVSVKWHKDRMAQLGVTDIYDKQGNIRVAANYLSELFQRYDGDIYKVLKEYNGDTSDGISDYMADILEISEALERVHGK